MAATGATVPDASRRSSQALTEADGARQGCRGDLVRREPAELGPGATDDNAFRASANRLRANAKRVRANRERNPPGSRRMAPRTRRLPLNGKLRAHWPCPARISVRF